MNKIWKISVRSFLAGLVFVQPVVARNISLAYSEIEQMTFTPSIPFESKGMIQDLFDMEGNTPNNFVGDPLQKKPHKPDAPSTESDPSPPLADSVALEALLSGVKESETVGILSAMAALHYVAPLVSFHPGAALAVGALKYGSIYSLLHRHTPECVYPVIPLVSGGVKSSVSFLWDHKWQIASAAMALGSAAMVAYQSNWVREPVLYSYFNNIGPISQGVYALNSGTANNTLFALDAWLRVEADKDGGKFLHTMVDQLVPAAALALVPKVFYDWGSFALGGVATDFMLPKLPGSPVPTISDIVVRQPLGVVGDAMEWVTAPASVQVYYSPTAASSLGSIGGMPINTPQLYMAATHYMNLQKFSHVNKIDIGFLLSRIQYYQKRHSGGDIKAEDGKQIAVWFQDMASIDELAQKLAKCIRQEDVSQIQHWVEQPPVLEWRPQEEAHVAPQLPAAHVKKMQEEAEMIHEFTQKRHKRDYGVAGNIGVALAEWTVSYFGWGGRGK